MRSVTITLGALVVLAMCPMPARAQETCELQGTWWQEPARWTRHSTLVASFDSTENNDADYARDMALSGGYAMDPDVPGLHGSATQIARESGYLHFRGGSNFQGLHGTMRVQVKGELWADETPQWLFDTGALDPATGTRYRTGVLRERGKLSLVLIRNRDEWAEDDEIARLDLDTGPVSTGEWHSVVASWDRASGMGWLALDGRGVSGPMQFHESVRAAHAIFLGAGSGYQNAGGIAPPGSAFDDFVLYDLPLPVLEAEPSNQLAAADAELLPQAEAAARRTLNLLADLQGGGGWNWAYTWPTLIGLSLPNITQMWPDAFLLNIDKGNSTMAVVEDFTYAYDVLGDQRFAEVMARTAEALLAGQYPDGYWALRYYIKPDGLQGLGIVGQRQVKFQDHVQSYPMFFLAYMYRLSGDQRYLDAVMRAGEFYITAQNPNGSYPHHYDPQDGIGKTATGLPQGGELNDGAANDAIDVMAFMYHMTGEPRYVQALKRVGDWLIEAQGEHIPLWADQYDADGNPIWARGFEPPSCGYSGTEYTLQGLLQMYRFSGEERYLEPMRKTLSWVEENLPDGEMAYSLELGTARPIAAWENEIYYLDQPEDVAFLQTVPIGRWELEPHPMLATARALVERVAEPMPPAMTPAEALEALPLWRGRAQAFLATQNEAGLWTTQRHAMRTVGEFILAPQWEVRTVLRYVETARTALGEIPAERRGQADPRATAYPHDDWYEVDWWACVQ